MKEGKNPQAISLRSFSSVELSIKCRLLPLKCGAIPLKCGAIPLKCGAIPLKCGAIPLKCGAIPLECGFLIFFFVHCLSKLLYYRPLPP